MQVKAKDLAKAKAVKGGLEKKLVDKNSALKVVDKEVKDEQAKLLEAEKAEFSLLRQSYEATSKSDAQTLEKGAGAQKAIAEKTKKALEKVSGDCVQLRGTVNV